MDVRILQIIKSDIQGRGQIRERSVRIRAARISDKCGKSDSGIYPDRRRAFVCNHVSQAVRKERTAGTNRMLPLDGAARSGCGNGQGLSNMETTIIECDAASRTRIKAQHSNAGSVGQGERLYIQD